MNSDHIEIEDFAIQKICEFTKATYDLRQEKIEIEKLWNKYVQLQQEHKELKIQDEQKLKVAEDQFKSLQKHYKLKLKELEGIHNSRIWKMLRKSDKLFLRKNLNN